MTPRAKVLADVAIAVGALLAMLFEQWVGEKPQPPLSILLTVAMAGSLAFRRRYPLAVAFVNGGALVAQATFFFVGGVYPNSNLVATYSVGAHPDRRRAFVGLGLTVLGVSGYFANVSAPISPLAAMVVFFWSLAWVAGYASTRRQEAADEERDRQAAVAVGEERDRIARELHDLVGHTVSVMVVQAGAARRQLDRDVAQAHRSLVTIEQVGRTALDELDRMLGTMRKSDPELAPQPRLSDIDQLVDRFEGSGLDVSLVVDGAPSTVLPASVELSAYRIIQEALTNTLRHAHATSAQVSIAHRPDGVEVVVLDDGSGGRGSTPGRGLLGIVERVGVFGGDVEHGPAPGGGFRVRAFLPV